MRPVTITLLATSLVFLTSAGNAQVQDARRPQAPSKSGTRPKLTNFVGMTLVLIPAGEFEMGLRQTFAELAQDYPLYREPSPYGKHTPRVEELVDMPLHKVRITHDFYMGAHEVTIANFKRFVEETGFKTEAERDGTGGYGVNPATKEWSTARDKRFSWRNPGFPQGDDHPVLNVTWADAVAFCDWLSKKEGRKYRLPTEAEWEYACRAGSKTYYFFGDNPEDLAKYANTYDASCARFFPEWARWAIKADDGFVFTAPVGSFKPNAFGLYDMHGNAWEWCSDHYGSDTYVKSPLDDPQGGPPDRRRSRRGGGWHVWPLYCTSFYRNYNTPQSRYLNLGFRVVMERTP
jgi:formylglycine-generating enzyme required for sulfatase activity